MQEKAKKIQILFLCIAVLFGMARFYAVPVQAEMTVKPKVSIGKGFAVALKDDGTAWVWGNNAEGIFGNPSFTGSFSSYPVAVAMPENTFFCDISAGTDHVLALASDGSIWAWGSNNVGQLGHNNGSQSNAPTKIASFSDATVVSIAAGNHMSMALLSDHSVYSWGNDSTGLLGISNEEGTDDDSTYLPTRITALEGVCVNALYTGEVTNAVRTEGGGIYFWGANDRRQSGVSSGSIIHEPTQKDTKEVPVLDVALGYSHSSLLLSGETGSTVKSMGLDNYGQFGNGKTDNADTITAVFKEAVLQDADGNAIKVTAVAAGTDHMVALTDSGAVYTWGSNTNSQLGHAGETPRLPTAVSALSDVKATAIASAYDTTAVIDENGYIYLWGNDRNGGLGTLTEPQRLTTSSGAVFELGVPFTDIVQNVFISANASVPSPTYIVTIPATVNAEDLNQKSGKDENKISSTPIVVRASGVGNLFEEKQVAVYLSEETDPFVLTDGTHTLPYVLYNSTDADGSAVQNGGVFAVFTADGSQTGRIEIDQSLIRHTGVYRDTITFQVRLENILQGEQSGE